MIGVGLITSSVFLYRRNKNVRLIAVSLRSVFLVLLACLLAWWIKVYIMCWWFVIELIHSVQGAGMWYECPLAHCPTAYNVLFHVANNNPATSRSSMPPHCLKPRYNDILPFVFVKNLYNETTTLVAMCVLVSVCLCVCFTLFLCVVSYFYLAIKLVWWIKLINKH